MGFFNQPKGTLNIYFYWRGKRYYIREYSIAWGLVMVLSALAGVLFMMLIVVCAVIIAECLGY